MKFRKAIKDDADYEAALERIEELWNTDPDSEEGSEMKLLLLLVKEYEEDHFEPIPFPDPIEAIKVRMEDLNLKPKDLVPAIGDKGTVSKVLNRKKPLSLRMIRNLSKMLSLPVEVLIQETKVEAA